MIEVIHRLLLEIRPHKKKVLIIAMTGILYSVAYARLMLMLRGIYDGFQSGQQEEVAQVGLWAVGLALVVALSRYFHIFTMNYVSELAVNSLRLKLQAKFMNLNLAFHNRYAAGSGGLLSRVLNDVKVVQDGLRMVADFFREPLLAILLLGNLFFLNWRLTLCILILLPLILWFLRQISRSLRKYVLWGQEHLEKITSTVKESLDGVRIIQSFGLEKTMADKLRGQTDEYLEIRRRVHSRIEMMGPVTEFIATCLILGIFFYFSVEVGKGNITTGAVIAYIASLMSINAPIKKLQESYVRIQETVVASGRIFQLMDEGTEVPQDRATRDFPKDWKKIVYRRVCFGYGEQSTIHDIDLEIQRGERIAFVGESGSGKSTLVNLLGRFYDPSSGEVLIDSTPLPEIKLPELRRHIALVTQDVFLFSDTIEKNIEAGRFGRDPRLVVEAAKSANAHDFISRMPAGYQTQVGDRGNLLSGGEKQRVSIARAVFKDAPILILDEATSALDSASEIEVQKGLDRLMEGRTSLVIAHRLSTIQSADRIVVMKEGRIVEVGGHEELLRRGGEYARFHALQNK